jgi:hypothetical protein
MFLLVCGMFLLGWAVVGREGCVLSLFPPRFRVGADSSLCDLLPCWLQVGLLSPVWLCLVGGWPG